MIDNMKATLLLKERHIVSAHAFAEILVWQLPQPLKGSAHALKYSLAFIVNGVCVLRYDNEQGKGDHRHCGNVETAYSFTTPQQLIADFWQDIENWRQL